MRVHARQLKPTPYKRVCDWDGPNHSKIIPPGRVAYQIPKDFEAAGTYHGPQCYRAAFEKYKDLKQQIEPQQPTEES